MWTGAATEQSNSQLDTNNCHPQSFPSRESLWHDEQPIDEEGNNETTQNCVNCHLLKSEYGRVLFERDLAQRNLRIANYRLGDKLQKQRNKEDNGMGTYLFFYDFFFNLYYFYLYWWLLYRQALNLVNVDRVLFAKICDHCLFLTGIVISHNLMFLHVKNVTHINVRGGFANVRP